MLFDAFYWALSLITDNSATTTTPTDTEPAITEASQRQQKYDRDRLHEGTLEFIEAWLGLIQKLVNTKNMLETRHALTGGTAATGAGILSSQVLYSNVPSAATSAAAAPSDPRSGRPPTGAPSTTGGAPAASNSSSGTSFDPVRFLFKV